MAAFRRMFSLRQHLARVRAFRVRMWEGQDKDGAATATRAAASYPDRALILFDKLLCDPQPEALPAMPLVVKKSSKICRSVALSMPVPLSATVIRAPFRLQAHSKFSSSQNKKAASTLSIGGVAYQVSHYLA